MCNFRILSVLLLGSIILAGCNGDKTTANNIVAPSSTDTAVNTAADQNKPNTYGVKHPDRLFQLDKLATTTIKTAGGDIKLWIMDTESKRQEGMMFLKEEDVKDNEGMIFVFPDVQKLSGNYSFWMHNTILPLDIDYISKDKKVLNVGLGKAMNDDPVKPKGDYFYVIELKQGKSAKFGLTEGTKVQISDDLKTNQ